MVWMKADYFGLAERKADRLAVMLKKAFRLVERKAVPTAETMADWWVVHWESPLVVPLVVLLVGWLVLLLLWLVWVGAEAGP